MELDLPTYAALAAELAAAGEARAEVLGRHGLDDAGWEAIDTLWQTRLSEALDEHEGDGVPALLADFAREYGKKQRELGVAVPLERFAEITRRFGASGDLRAALAQVGVSLTDYVQAAEHWSGRLAADPELELRFQRELGAVAPVPATGRGPGRGC